MGKSKELSLRNIEDVVLKSNDNSLLPLLCHPEWLYQLKNLFPIIRKINQERTQRNSQVLIVTPIDSIAISDVTQESIAKDSENKKRIIEKECQKFEVDVYVTLKIHLNLASYDRENATSELFLKTIEKFQPEEKAIIFYHQAHIFQHAQACMTSKSYNEKNELFLTKKREANWLQISRGKKSFSIKTIAIDHSPLEHPNNKEKFFGVLNSTSNNFANSLYPIFYPTDSFQIFDSIVFLKDKKYIWYEIDGVQTPSQIDCSKTW